MPLKKLKNDASLSQHTIQQNFQQFSDLIQSRA